jgi:hypothetical protein
VSKVKVREKIRKLTSDVLQTTEVRGRKVYVYILKVGPNAAFYDKRHCPLSSRGLRKRVDGEATVTINGIVAQGATIRLKRLWLDNASRPIRHGGSQQLLEMPKGPQGYLLGPSCWMYLSWRCHIIFHPCCLPVDTDLCNLLLRSPMIPNHTQQGGFGVVTSFLGGEECKPGWPSIHAQPVLSIVT